MNETCRKTEKKQKKSSHGIIFCVHLSPVIGGIDLDLDRYTHTCMYVVVTNDNAASDEKALKDEEQLLID